LFCRIKQNVLCILLQTKNGCAFPLRRRCMTTIHTHTHTIYNNNKHIHGWPRLQLTGQKLKVQQRNVDWPNNCCDKCNWPKMQRLVESQNNKQVQNVDWGSSFLLHWVDTRRILDELQSSIGIYMKYCTEIVIHDI